MNDVRKRILISDSDAEILIVLERMLEDEGFNTTTASTTEETLRLLETQDFDLVLAADHPPELDCEAILRVSQNRQVPVVALENRPRHPFAEPYLLSRGAKRIVHKWEHQEIREAANDFLLRRPVEGGKSAVAATG